MVTKMLFAAALIAGLILPAVAQNGKAKPFIDRQILGGNSNTRNGNPPTVPSYCNPCLSYGGDWDPNSTAWVAYANWNTTGLGTATAYIPFIVPAGKTWTVTGLFTNDLALNATSIDPPSAAWSISSGVSKGVGGTTIASGTDSASFNPTGRNYQNLYFEYTTLVTLSSPVVLTEGTYWLSVVPPCTNGNDSQCGSAAYYITDSTSKTNEAGPPEPVHRSFTFSSTFGYDYLNLCSPTEGYLPPSCSVMSAGVLGTHN
jgi:hypothetical protein